MMTVIVNVFEAAGLTVSEKNTETMPLRTPNQTPLTSPLVIEAAGQRHKQTVHFLYLSDLVNKTYYARDQTTGSTPVDMLRSVQAGAVRCGNRFVHAEGAHVKPGVMEALLHRCVAWTLRVEHFAVLYSGHRLLLCSDNWLPSRTTHRQALVLCQGSQEGTMRER